MALADTWLVGGLAPAGWPRGSQGGRDAPPAKVISQATGVVLVILGVAVVAIRLFM